jgi:hypothetical protein
VGVEREIVLLKKEGEKRLHSYISSKEVEVMQVE